MDPIVADDVAALEAEAARHWWVYIVAGVLWILYGWVVLSFDYTTVWAVAVFVGFGLLAGGVMGIVIGLDAPAWRWLHVTFGVLSIGAGLLALLWPGQTFLVLAAIIGWYVMLTGVVDLLAAVATRGENDMWWLQLVLGLAQILVGFWAIGYEGRSIALLVVWVGAMALARGVSSLVIGFGLHGADKQLRRQMAA